MFVAKKVLLLLVISRTANVDLYKCRHIQMSLLLCGWIHPRSNFKLVQTFLWLWKHIQISRIKRKTITELIQCFTECSIAWRPRNVSITWITAIFVTSSRARKQAECQCKSNGVSGSQICTTWHSAGISVNVATLGSTLVGSLSGHFTSTEALKLPQCLWNDPENMGNQITRPYGDVIMGEITSQITSLSSVYSTVYSDADQRKYQSSASLAFVWGIHRGPVNFPHKWPVTRNKFPFDDVIMESLGANSIHSETKHRKNVLIFFGIYCI